MKKVVLGLTTLLAVTAMTACDDVEVSLNKSAYDAPILTGDGESVPNNKLGEIYDALVKSGDGNSEKVLNNVLLKIAEARYGTFEELKAAAANGGNAWAESHKAFKDGKAVVAFYNNLLTRINKTFIGYTLSDAYIKNSRFYEERFYNVQKDALYKLGAVAKADFKGNAGAHYTGIQTTVSIDYNAGNEYGSTEVKKFFQDDYLTIYKDYIDKNILPDLYKKALVQDYLIANNYVALGRSAARKVQYVSLSKNANYSDATQNLLTAYAKLVLNGGAGSLSAEKKAAIAAHYGTTSKDLNFVADLYKGALTGWDGALLEAAKDVYAAANFTLIPQNEIEGFGLLETYSPVAYKETTYGGYLSDYAKIKVGNRYTNDATIYSDFTGNGAHEANVGMEIKVQALAAVDNTTEGWFTESSIGSLASTYKERLFKNTIATDVVTPAAKAAADFDKNAEKNYGSYLDGDFYLTREKYENNGAAGFDATPFLLKEKDSGTWYICRVDEAIKNSKLRESSADYYGAEGNGDILAEVEYEISYMLSDNTSYVKNANQHYIKEAAISYHDQAVYDYFKKTFPDLFED
ncbi:MAG: hypothetical protein J6328_01480 [Bacilli bacterium]|nr:hypothetical protein [Bacilli bacterium]